MLAVDGDEQRSCSGLMGASAVSVSSGIARIANLRRLHPNFDGDDGASRAGPSTSFRSVNSHRSVVERFQPCSSGLMQAIK